jgi:hypothetical protein
MSSVSSITIIEGGGGGFVAAGDLSGSSTSQTVIKINGSTVSASPSTNAVLVATSSSATSWSTIVNANVNAAAAIVYSKLSLTNSILNADINSAAAITYSKLSLTGNIVNADINSSAAIVYSKLSLTGNVVNADISNTAAIVYSKLSLSNGIVNADINSTAAIAYSKLSLTGHIVNANISATAAIAGTKITPAFGSQNISNTGSITQSGGAISLSGNATSTITTTVGNLNIDTVASLNLGISTATDVNIGTTSAAVNIVGGVDGTGTLSVGGVTTIEAASNGSFLLNVQNDQDDNTGNCIFISGGASATGGTPGAFFVQMTNTDSTTLSNIIQDASLIGVNITPGSDNHCSLGTASLGFANVCTHGFDWLGSTAVSATAGTHGDVPAQVLGYLILQVAGVNVKVPYYNN